MTDPVVTVHPHGRETFPSGPPEVAIRHRGCEIVFVFEPDDTTGERNITELKLRPDIEQLEPRVLRQFAPQAERYLKAARQALKWRANDLKATIDELRQVGRPGRGHTPGFYKGMAQHYEDLVREGERHPIKALAEIYHVTMGASSRWIKEARRRGLIKEEATQ